MRKDSESVMARMGFIRVAPGSGLMGRPIGGRANDLEQQARMLAELPKLQFVIHDTPRAVPFYLISDVCRRFLTA
jgi:hypothetical protein